MLKYAKQLFNIFSKPKEHTYEVFYFVRVKNLLEGENKVSIALPIPFRTSYQEILGEPAFSAKGRIINDFRFGNSVIIWEETLSADSLINVSENFKIKIRGRDESINSAFSVKNYEKLKDNLGYRVYTEPAEHLSGADNRVRDLAKSIVGSEDNLKTVAKKLYDFVVEKLNYGSPVAGLYSFSDALTKDEVDCGGFDSLLGSLYMSLGIPARIVAGFWVNGSGKEISDKMHAWLEFMLPDGRWFPVDPSVEHLRKRKRSKRQGGFGKVGGDRIAFSYGSDIALEIGSKKMVFDILQNPVVATERGGDSVEVKVNLVAKKLE